MKSRLLLLLVLLMGAFTAQAQDPANYPPDDTTVVIDSTNLPIVWIEVNGATIDRVERVGARMKVIHNGDGRLNYGDTVAHPGQHIDYEGYIALRYRGNTTYTLGDKKPYSFRTLSHPLEESDVKNILVLQNTFEKTRKQMKVNTLSINALSDNLNFPMFAKLILKKT